MTKRTRLIVTVVVALLAILLFLQKNRSISPKPDEPFNRADTRLILTKHARCRMDCRHIDESEIREILQSGYINMRKSEPAASPEPKYAIEGVTHDKQKVRIIVAASPRGNVVVTVIDLEREWQCDCN